MYQTTVLSSCKSQAIYFFVGSSSLCSAATHHNMMVDPVVLCTLHLTPQGQTDHYQHLHSRTGAFSTIGAKVGNFYNFLSVSHLSSHTVH